MNRTGIDEMKSANGTPEPGLYERGGEFGAVPERTCTGCGAPLGTEATGDRCLDCPPAPAEQPAAAPEPEKAAEVRPSTADRLDAIADRLDAMAGRLGAISDQVATLGRVQPTQGLLVNALIDAMDRVLADLHMDRVAWEAIVKQAGEGR